jgi:hypothetical protein
MSTRMALTCGHLQCLTVLARRLSHRSVIFFRNRRDDDRPSQFMPTTQG